jgi:type II secretory pathway component PulJ
MNLKLRIKKGFTFIDVLVGIALMLIVFLGIFGAYQLGLKVVGQSKNKIMAMLLPIKR